VICGGDEMLQCDKCVKVGRNMMIGYCSKCNSAHGYYTNDKKAACFDVKVGDRTEIRKTTGSKCDECKDTTYIDEYENEFYEAATIDD
jgi:uncharacterized C2H2 Zn-finger protein